MLIVDNTYYPTRCASVKYWSRFPNKLDKYLLDLSAASCLLGLRDELLDAVGELAHELVRLALLLGGKDRY